MKAPDEIKQLFQKVFIHSEADLPKADYYTVRMKNASISVVLFLSKNTVNWKLYDWYLLPYKDSQCHCSGYPDCICDTAKTETDTGHLIDMPDLPAPSPKVERIDDLEACYESFIRSNHLSREWETHYESWHNGEQPAEKATYTLNCNKCGVPCDFNEAFPKDQLCTNCFIAKYGNYMANPAVPKCEFNSYEKGMEPTQREVTLVCNNWMPDKGTSATRCTNCGKDRWQHKL